MPKPNPPDPVACFHVEPPHGDTKPSSTDGRIKGVVVDIDDGEQVAGVTVLADSLAGGAKEQAVLSDEHGAFEIEVPAGDYRLTIFYNDSEGSHPCVHVAGDAVTTVHVRLDTRDPATVRQL